MDDLEYTDPREMKRVIDRLRRRIAEFEAAEAQRFRPLYMGRDSIVDHKTRQAKQASGFEVVRTQEDIEEKDRALAAAEERDAAIKRAEVAEAERDQEEAAGRLIQVGLMKERDTLRTELAETRKALKELDRLDGQRTPEQRLKPGVWYQSILDQTIEASRPEPGPKWGPGTCGECGRDPAWCECETSDICEWCDQDVDNGEGHGEGQCFNCDHNGECECKLRGPDAEAPLVVDCSDDEKLAALSHKPEPPGVAIGTGPIETDTSKTWVGTGKASEDVQPKPCERCRDVGNISVDHGGGTVTVQTCPACKGHIARVQLLGKSDKKLLKDVGLMVIAVAIVVIFTNIIPIIVASIWY